MFFLFADNMLLKKCVILRRNQSIKPCYLHDLNFYLKKIINALTKYQSYFYIIRYRVLDNNSLSRVPDRLSRMTASVKPYFKL